MQTKILHNTPIVGDGGGEKPEMKLSICRVILLCSPVSFYGEWSILAKRTCKDYKFVSWVVKGIPHRCRHSDKPVNEHHVVL